LNNPVYEPLFGEGNWKSMRGNLDRAYFDFQPPRNRPVQVVGFGENAVDLVCQVPNFPVHDTKVRMNQMIRLGGGQIATACSLCARWGLKTRYLGLIGEDELGEFLNWDLNREPMEVCLESVENVRSHFSLIIVDEPTGSRTILWDRDSGLRYTQDALVRQKEKLIEGQLLHLDSHNLEDSIRAARWAKEAGLYTVIDIDKSEEGVEELLSKIDFAIVSLSFLEQYCGTDDWQYSLHKTAEVTDGLLAVTRGEAGASVLWDGEIHSFPAWDINPVDTTGAGDVFHGAFIYSLYQNWSVAETMRFSNAAGAISCTRLGARGGIPELQAVIDLARTM
jgi:sugar/nucleoside kinase (ribokinase family)